MVAKVTTVTRQFRSKQTMCRKQERRREEKKRWSDRRQREWRGTEKRPRGEGKQETTQQVWNSINRVAEGWNSTGHFHVMLHYMRVCVSVFVCGLRRAGWCFSPDHDPVSRITKQETHTCTHRLKSLSISSLRQSHPSISQKYCSAGPFSRQDRQRNTSHLNTTVTTNTTNTTTSITDTSTSHLHLVI